MSYPTTRVNEQQRGTFHTCINSGGFGHVEQREGGRSWRCRTWRMRTHHARYSGTCVRPGATRDRITGSGRLSGRKTTLEAGIGVWATGRSSRSGLFGSVSTAVASRCCAHRLVSLGDVGWLVRPRNHSRSVPVDSTVRPESVQGSRQWRSRPVAC